MKEMFTHESESHADKGVDEWLLVQGDAPPKRPLENPVRELHPLSGCCANGGIKPLLASRYTSPTSSVAFSNRVKKEAAAVRRWSFTLLELVVVLIILSILSTLGTQQYFRMIERSRSAEARVIMGQIRSMAAGYLMYHNNLTDFNNDEAAIGDNERLLPVACRPTYYFRYNVSTNDKNLTITAERCMSGGKEPDAVAPSNISLNTDFSSTGGDNWVSNPPGMY